MGKVIGELPDLDPVFATCELATGVQNVTAHKIKVALRNVLAMIGFR
jgi:hypothetical protein